MVWAVRGFFYPKRVRCFAFKIRSRITWKVRDWLYWKSPEDLTSYDIARLAAYWFKPKDGAWTWRIDYAPNISYDEYLSKVLTPIVAYLFDDSWVYKYNYIPSDEDKSLLPDYFYDDEIKKIWMQIYWRTENPSWLYSYFQVKNNTVSYTSLKDAFNKVLSSTWTEIIVDTLTYTWSSNTGTLNNTWSTNSGVVYDNISLGNISAYID